GALVRDRGSSANRFPFPFRFFYREVHLLPAKALVLEESLIFRNPKVLEEHLRNLRQIDPAVAERRRWPARQHYAALLDQHRQRQWRIDETHHRHLHRRDEEQNHKQEQNPFPEAGGFPFLCFRRGHLRQETAVSTERNPS